jgi:hypothetical protein
MFRRTVFFFTLILITMSAPLLAQHSAEAPKAPIPQQIADAKKVFISNIGGDSFAEEVYSHGRDYVYNEFYAAMKRWGHFEVVSSPADADLVIEVGLTVASSEARVIKGDTVGAGYDPQVRLVFLDPKTHVVLWSYLEHVPVALLKSNRDKNLDQTLTKIVENTKGLVAPKQPTTP